MGVAVSRPVTGNQQDVLAGTVGGVLPGNAPSFDVEVQLGAATGSDNDTATLLVNGVAILQNSFIPKQRSIDNLPAGRSYGPASDAPTAFFNAAAGSRITLNIDNAETSDVTSVYMEARENGGPPQPLSVGHIGQFNSNAAISEQDVLSGTPVGSLPLTANMWNVAIIAAMVLHDSSSTAGVGDLTFLVDSDTVAENFRLPVRFEHNFPIEERDTIITTLATGGSRLVLNLTGSATGNAEDRLVYRVFATPVG